MPGRWTTKKEAGMNWDRFEGNCKLVGGKAKEQLGKLTHDLPLEIAGRRDQLVGNNQERYGIAKEEAARQLKEFTARNRNWDFSNR